MIRHTLFFTIGMAVLAAGCNTLPGGPAIHTNMDDPLVLTPGEVRIITVRVDDRHGLVSRVIATVVSGETDKHVTLLDDGVTEPEGSRADDVAGDGVWSTRINVPLNFIEGETTIVFTALRANGLPVEVREDGEVVPLETPLTIQVRLPGE